MKHLSYFECAILSFFFGIIVSAYLTYLYTIGAVNGVLGHFSLVSLFGMISVPERWMIVAIFFWFTFVYMIYGFVLMMIMRTNSKAKFVIVPLVLIGFGYRAFTARGPEQDIGVGQVASVISSQAKTTTYYGTEARGDLDGDGKDDVAFIIPRSDNKELSYYLSASLKTASGFKGSGLLFLGAQHIPQTIAIEKGLISVGYSTGPVSTSTKQFYAQVINGELKQVSKSAATTTATSTPL